MLAVGVALGTGGLAVAAPSASRPVARAAPLPRLEGFVGIARVNGRSTPGPGSGPIGVAAAAPLGPGEQLDLRLAAPTSFRPSAPVPSETVSVLLNVTIDQDATSASFLTVWPTGQARPLTSANNAEPGVVSPNLTSVRLGDGGSVSFFNQQGTIDLVVDLVGYTLPIPVPAAVAGLAVTRQFEDLARVAGGCSRRIRRSARSTCPVGNYERHGHGVGLGPR